jgi:pimeloyl-ACP methyl ester carboxylesterase
MACRRGVRHFHLIVLAALLLVRFCHTFQQLPVRCRNQATSLSSIKSSGAPSQATVREEQVELSSGVCMQVMSCLPQQDTDKPVLMFLHGSFHAAWCWTEHFFPFFVSKGYPVVAPSLRGTAKNVGTGGTFAGEDVKKVKIMEHVADLEAFLEELPRIVGRDAVKPVVICHSFGGLAVMKYLENNPENASRLGGIVTICSVPPSGNGQMTMRFLRRSLRDSWKITRGFAMKTCLTDAVLCRQLFFGGDKQVLDDGIVDDFGVSDEDIGRYQGYFARNSEATIDLMDLAKKLPSSKVVDGKAPFVAGLPPCLVMGAKDDFLVDREGLDETALYFGLDEPTIVDSPHDVMLGSTWKNAADALDQWLETKR